MQVHTMHSMDRCVRAAPPRRSTRLWVPLGMYAEGPPTLGWGRHVNRTSSKFWSKSAIFSKKSTIFASQGLCPCTPAAR